MMRLALIALPCFRLFWDIQTYSRPFNAIQCYIGLFKVVQGYASLFKAFQGYSRLFMAFQGYSRLFKGVMWYVYWIVFWTPPVFLIKSEDIPKHKKLWCFGREDGVRDVG